MENTFKEAYKNKLCVIDRIEVGPVKIESKKLKMQYTVVKNGLIDTTDLVYKYEESVFEKQTIDEINLASMIGVQVAFNYGLFCKELVIHGEFSKADQKFITEMTENTSREILVKKFLEPNPFLKKELENLEIEKTKKYTTAEIIFSGKNAKNKQLDWHQWETDQFEHAILSSGGKDSLLSFGLINELGFSCHPLFVNESGRHWYTALNSYRYFKENIEKTGRVWTNSDRIFSWMLRHLDFIKENFQNIRFDEYPIRLWTVAVFLFGVLPLMKKRKIKRLIIGDEYDTTRKLVTKGITNYDGLFDQSRYFDQYLSRYFLKKGWSINQFSILRPLSEMLIEKILTARYENLQKHQVSCHAAHTENERVKPCGKCEKCRRIVGMLLAFGGNPENCGYDKVQVDNCLKSLVGKGVHQEASGAKHLMYLLEKKGIITNLSKKKYKPHDEIMKIRLDDERAAFKFIPLNLRKPLMKIYNEYSSGTVKRVGRNWVDWDVFKDPDIETPYPFEPVNQGFHKEEKLKNGSFDGFKWSEMTYCDAEERLKEIDIAILPVGAIEQHGPHLPLDVDSFDANYLAKKVAEASSDPKPLVLPLIPYGVSHEHDDFKGTLSISNDSLSSIVYDIGKAVARNGIKKLIIINGHGGNGPALNYAAQKINRDAQIFVCVDSGETSDVDIYSIIKTPNDIHAGEVETSTTLAVRPNVVKMKLAKKMVPQFSSKYLDYTSKRGILWYSYTKRISDNGVLGDPTKASEEKGRKIWEMMISHLVSLVDDLKNLPLDDIYQKRY